MGDGIRSILIYIIYYAIYYKCKRTNLEERHISEQAESEQKGQLTGSTGRTNVVDVCSGFNIIHYYFSNKSFPGLSLVLFSPVIRQF